MKAGVAAPQEAVVEVAAMEVVEVAPQEAEAAMEVVEVAATVVEVEVTVVEVVATVAAAGKSRTRER